MILKLCFLTLFFVQCSFSMKAPPGVKDADHKHGAEQAGEADGHMIEGDMRVDEKTTGGSDRNMVKDSRKLWPKDSNGIVIVPYVFDNVKDAAKEKVAAAVADYERWTCIKFVPRSNQKNYLKIHHATGCWSYVGMQNTGPQLLSLGTGCYYDVGTPTHEMMHALGFQHEQSREDRDKYIEVKYDNIEDKYTYAFDICDSSRCKLPTSPYDYTSVMHYEAYAFSKNKEDTIVPKSSQSDVVLGQRKGLSRGDIQKLNELYTCGGKTVTSNKGHTVPAEIVKDNRSDCNLYMSYCQDKTYTAWMHANCAKSCGYKA